MEKGQWLYNFDDIEFGDLILAEDDYGRYRVLKVVEGEQYDDGRCGISFLDECENHDDEIEIVRFIKLADVLPIE